MVFLCLFPMDKIHQIDVLMMAKYVYCHVLNLCSVLFLIYLYETRLKTLMM